MGWNVVGSCIFIWLKDNNFNWFSVEISTFKYSFESYIEKGNWGFEILIDFSIKFKALKGLGFFFFGVVRSKLNF
jgi:hypothetical protein